MKSWIAPLPCEGTISAVLGAALGVILGLDGGLASKTWTSLPTQLSLIGFVIVFAISLHFSCTAILKRSGALFAFFFILCLMNGLLFNFFRLQNVEVDQGHRITFMPDNVALSVTVIFLAWFTVQTLLSYAVSIFGEKRR